MTDDIVRPDRNIPLEQVQKLAATDPLWANRGKAIQAYASLEQSLCTVFADAGGMKSEVAGIIFFRLTNT
ncbi:MAG TPA: hypothetical protein VI113_11465, partial [Alphaproteobacteria bacterium]